ncbi:hypothetical protein [Paenibacillus dokdonensis]|uniref:hypothetical protein n=1 Tax=Paenibacillus dokdonensis TaxID=2567944 RepID=UPI003CCC8795
MGSILIDHLESWGKENGFSGVKKQNKERPRSRRRPCHGLPAMLRIQTLFLKIFREWLYFFHFKIHPAKDEKDDKAAEHGYHQVLERQI